MLARAWQDLASNGSPGEISLGSKRTRLSPCYPNPRIEDAARAASVGARTLMRWIKEPAFEKAYMKARRTAFRHSLARLQQMSGAAVSTLGKIMVDQNSPASTRVRAAECIINQGAKAIEIGDVDGA